MQVVRLALEAIDHAMTVRPCGMIVHDDPRALHANGSLRHDDMARVGRGLVFVAYRKVVSPNVHRLPRIPVSYTHLDVYKRQEPFPAIAENGSVASLLAEPAVACGAFVIAIPPHIL